ncbi:MAG: protein kinase [Planctomycetia bacterium]|nr:protein kinase [Planctomycetia bacterium]
MAGLVQSVDEFLQVVRRSGLVEEDRLMAAVEPWIGHAGPPPEPMLAALTESGLLTQWQIEQLLKGRHKGFTLGKYKLLRLLGAGGMSSVYLAEHATLRSKVAIKVLPVKRVDQTSYLARFEREARQSARLSHPNIVRTFDLDTAGAIHYIAMEYVDGIDLHAKVKRDGPLSVREAADSIRQAAAGLQHAHEEGLVHRDIKPANLIVDGRGTVKILDLGLALAGGDEDGSLTREHDEKVLGTADYLAPEQATDSHKADRRSDIYSLGCTLYYLLVGKAPFASGKLADRLQAHLHKPPPNLLDERPDVPVAITELYFRMLEKHPDGRPQSAREVADALAAWLANTADAAAGPKPEGPRRALPRRAVSGAAAPGVVVRSGPGSSNASSGIFPFAPAPSSTSGSGSLPATPSPSSIARAQPSFTRIEPRAATGPGGAAPILIDTTKSAVGSPASKPRPATKPPKNIAGLPLGLWIAIGIGIALAIGLGIMLLMKG